MQLRATRLRRPEWIVGAGGLVLLGAMLLLPWFQPTLTSAPPGPRYFVGQQVDGWNGLNPSHWLLLATILMALAVAFFQAERRAPAIPVTLSPLAALLGGLTAIWLIFRVVIDPPGGREIGGWIGLLGSLAIVYGGIASVRDEGIDPADGPEQIPTVSLAEELTG